MKRRAKLTLEIRLPKSNALPKKLTNPEASLPSICLAASISAKPLSNFASTRTLQETTKEALVIATSSPALVLLAAQHIPSLIFK
ncbi:hypothetical protein JCM5353_000102 [Sporobolomyces roseus]